MTAARPPATSTLAAAVMLMFIATVQLLLVVVAVLGTLFVWLVLGWTDDEDFPLASTAELVLALVVVIAVAVLGVLTMWTGVAVYVRQAWARIAGMVLGALYTVLGLSLLVTSIVETDPRTAMGLALAGAATIILLSLPSTVADFGRPDQ